MPSNCSPSNSDSGEGERSYRDTGGSGNCRNVGSCSDVEVCGEMIRTVLAFCDRVASIEILATITSLTTDTS